MSELISFSMRDFVQHRWQQSNIQDKWTVIENPVHE